jgi:hypothetical protein
MTKAKTKTRKPPVEQCRLPGPDDPLTTAEQDRLFQIMDRELSRWLLPGEMVNFQRMRATLRWYRSLLPELGEDYDELLPARVRHNRIDYLHEPACRVTPCSEEVARAAAAQFAVRPLSLVHLPAAEPARLPYGAPPDDEDFEDFEPNYNDDEEC